MLYLLGWKQISLYVDFFVCFVHVGVQKRDGEQLDMGGGFVPVRLEEHNLQYGVMERRCEILDPETLVAILPLVFFIRYE